MAGETESESPPTSSLNLLNNLRAAEEHKAGLKNSGDFSQIVLECEKPAARQPKSSKNPRFPNIFIGY